MSSEKYIPRLVPENYMLDISPVCNLKCPDCPTGARKEGLTKGIMTLDAFERFFEMVAGNVKNIAFYNWGEPFLNKYFLDMVKICTSHNVVTEIDTNLSATDFSDDDAFNIIKSGLTIIRPSIDGISQEIYEKFRVGGDLSRVMKNIRKLIAAKKELGAPTIIYFKFIVSSYNEHEVQGALDLAESLDVPVRFALLRSARQGCSSSYHQRPQMLQSINQKYYDFCKAHGIGKLGVFKTISDGIALHESLGVVCHQPFDTMIINWNGDVYPCCAVYGDRYALGNIFESNVEAVWNGMHYDKCRTFLKNFGPIQNGDSVCETEKCPISPKYDKLSYSNPKKAIIHIGAHKTGTTSIQLQLHDNSRKLKDINVNYPMDFDHFDNKGWFGQHAIAKALRQGPGVDKNMLERYANVLDKISHLSRDTDTILSSEDFSLLSLEQITKLKELLDGFECHIVFYVRRQDESSQSLYQTAVIHNKYSHDFEYFFKNSAWHFDYYTIATLWEKVFGHNRIHVRCFDRRSFKGGDVVKDFVHVVEGILGRSLGHGAWKIRIPESNKGLPMHVIALVRYYNSFPDAEPAIQSLVELSRILYGTAKIKHDIIPPSMRRRVIDQFEEGNIKLCKEFLGSSEDKNMFDNTETSETDKEWIDAHSGRGFQLKQLALDATNLIKNLENELDSLRSSAEKFK